MFRTSQDKQGEKERVRAALLRAALRLAAAHGFASLGLREVAREAGIAPTSFYRHFADMQELGLALSRELVGGTVSEVCQTLRAGAGATPIASRAWDAMLQAFVSDAELMRFFVAERVGASELLRANLQGVLSSVARALASESLPPAAADAASVILLDACARALSETEAGRAELRERCVWALGRLLDTGTESSAHVSHPRTKSGR